MMNKTMAIELSNAKGSLSNGNSKGTKLIRKVVFPSLRLVYGQLVFECGKEWYHF